MITRWSDPFRELERFQNQMNRLFSENFGGYGRGAGDREGIAVAWAPPVDICETPDHLAFQIEVPGFKENELTLRAENGVLTVEGERKFEDEKKEKNFHRVERSYGRFIRSFTLPANVSTENVKASLNDGILNVEMPKREESKPKSIPIGASSAQKQMGTSQQQSQRQREPELAGVR
jgi:HSP20 family protein